MTDILNKWKYSYLDLILFIIINAITISVRFLSVRSRITHIVRCLFFVMGCIGINSGVLAADPLRIGWVYAMANTPVLVAYHNGFFNHEGVQVELRRFNSGPLLKRAFEAGDLDMGYVGMPPVYHSIAEGSDLKIVAKVNYGQAALITSIDSPIKSLADLKNKKIAGVRYGSGMDVLLKSFILEDVARLDADKDVTILHMPPKMMVASVNKKVVDAAFTWEPYISFAVISGHAKVLFDMNKAVPNYPWYVIVASKQTRTKNRDAMHRVLKAHKRAVAYLNADTNAANDLIIATFKIRSALDAAQIQVNAHKVVLSARGRLGWDERFLKADEKFLQSLMNHSYKLGFLKTKLDVDDVIDRESIEWMNSQL
ncbi:ABC transporter, substrate-binding protein (cluster 10, nitrate/sulfonate/bicarbonate) [hydrothermal vent metagenome]|uniref:ABC transporter, substrate-binding protein (Cluster 10, nitrate/sulfonate/bicarbonate) n=1 Tax=hydrothermal vent metagenome TaxID=652676 RepID=A0A3B1AUN9_9ZZZZ